MAGQRPERNDVVAVVPTGATDGRARVDAEDATRALAELGLSQYEGRLYAALLRVSDGTAAELARESRVPRPKVYEALRALESRGFCAALGDRVMRYRAVRPDVALRDWVRHRDHERATQAEHEQALLETLVAALPVPEDIVGTQPPDYIEGIFGPARLTEALEELIGRAERSVWMLMQPPWLQPRSRWNLAEAAAARRGVEVRVIYSPEALRDRKRYVDLTEAGGQCRTLPTLPMKLLVRDGVEALVSLRDTHTGEQTMVTVAARHPDLARPLGLLFRQEWEKATPIDEEEAST